MSRNGAHERSGPMNDPVDVVRHVAPAVEPPSALLERVRSDLMTTITESDPIPARRPSRRRRRWAVPIAAAAVLATAAAGWAAVRHDSSTNTAIGCPHRDRGGNSTFIAAVTGDPVVDCGNAWRDMFGTEPPPMTAYDTGSGGVVVLLDGEPVPDGYTRLAPGPHVDTTLIQLQAALDDSGSGLTSNCFDEPGARNVVERELDRLGLDDWTVTVDESRPPTGAASCAYLVVDAEQQEVQLIGMGPAPSEAGPYRIFAAELDQRLRDQCVGLDAAADITRGVAAATDVSSYTDYAFTEESGLLNIHTVEDPSATCTRADVDVGGAVEVTLRGPA